MTQTMMMKAHSTVSTVSVSNNSGNAWQYVGNDDDDNQVSFSFSVAELC